MSGRPHKDAVAEAVSWMDKISQLGPEIHALNVLITESQKRLAEAKEELREAWSKHRKVMESMDLTQEGNFGFEGRATWFLSELRRQVEAERSHTKANGCSK